MAVGIPCVLPDSGIYPEMIANTQGGVLHRARDVDHLADQLAIVLQDTDRRGSMSLAARRAIEQHYHVTAMAEGVLAIYNV